MFETDQRMYEVLVPILTTLLAAIIGSYLTVQKFKREKHWQEKYAAYRDAVSAVENVRFWGDEIAADAALIPTSGFPEGKAPHTFLSEALRKLDQYAVIGKMLLSDEFCSLIEELRSEIATERFKTGEDSVMTGEHEELHYWSAHGARIRDIVDQRLPKILAQAKHDLK